MEQLCDLQFQKRIPSVAEFRELRQNAGWGIPPEASIAKALQSTLFGVCVLSPEGKTIGMARLVGDGGVQFFITDVIVHKDWHNRGIGSQIMKLLMEYVDQVALPGTFVGLFSANGREEFYKRFGFFVRPHEQYGAGMSYLHKQS